MTLDPTGRFILNSVSNRPVFIIGDSAWSLQGQLSDEEIELYLADRESKGFNLIVMELVENYYSNHPPQDAYGNVPFNGSDFTNQNPAYWLRVDRTISRAAAHGITILADPAFVGFDCKGTKGGYCQSYHSSSKEVIQGYGEFLGSRYKDVSNIIWLIGGDANPEDTDLQSKLYALAKGIRTKDPAHLMTTENYRGTSSLDIWSEAAWLDINALYLKPTEILPKTAAAYTKDRLPIFLLEDWYEGSNSLSDLDIRKQGYWAVLSGCTLGRVFGNYAIWNFSWTTETKDPWRAQLDSPGSAGQSNLGKLFRSREHWKLVPDADHEVLTAGYDPRPWFSLVKEWMRSWLYQVPFRLSSNASVAARSSDGQTIIVYIPGGSAATASIDMGKIADPLSRANCWWFNPRDASTRFIGIFPTQGIQKFTPPENNDWALVIDSQAAKLASPGSKDL
ncbi:MAG TPA: DUF4038 domain-containing protein [Candidatus Acidoferrum sp.]|nr:DUF4038 domain-containing protein [Candidatus Acidoferrum sp.]